MRSEVTTMTSKTATMTPRLLWSEHGAIGCELPGHAPYPGSDTYVWERWRRITPREAAEFEREVGRPPACEACLADSRRPRRAD